jgi:hypothetical protein
MISKKYKTVYHSSNDSRLKRRARGNRKNEQLFLEMLQKDCKPIVVKKNKFINLK